MKKTSLYSLAVLVVTTVSCVDERTVPLPLARPDSLRILWDSAAVLPRRDQLRAVDSRAPDGPSQPNCVWEQMLGQPPSELMIDIHGTAVGTHYAAGAWTGVIYKSDDRVHWSMDFPGTPEQLGFGAIWAVDTPLAVGAFPKKVSPYLTEFKPALFTRNNGVWANLSSMVPDAGDGILRDVWRSPSGKVYLAHWGGVLVEAAGGWQQVVQPPSGYRIWALLGFSDANVIALAVSQSPYQAPHKSLHFNGTSWSAKDIGTYPDLVAIHGSSPSNVFAVGGNHSCGAIAKGTIVRYDGLNWQHVTDVPENPFGVWTSGSQDAWVVGDDPCNTTNPGIVLHYDGQSIKKENLPQHTYAIWGTSQQTLVVAAEKMIYWRSCK